VVVVADFGLAIKVNETNEISLSPNYDALGGNPNHLAPEIKYTNLNNNNDSAANQPQVISYKKQASWELGLIAYEILFGEYPSAFAPSSSNADQYFSLSHFQELYYERYSASGGGGGGGGGVDYQRVSANQIAALLQPLLRSNAFERQHIWDAYRSFLRFIKSHFPNHPASQSFSL
jgi:serine/threonine protein kinase